MAGAPNQSWPGSARADHSTTLARPSVWCIVFRKRARRNRVLGFINARRNKVLGWITIGIKYYVIRVEEIGGRSGGMEAVG